MADGPSGVRLSRQFYRDKKGKVHPIGQGGIPESVLEYLPKVLQRLLNALVGKNKAPKDAKVEEQYATALPIGTALAQSWNTDFLYECGNIVGDEMKRFGVHLWLAPALNIHRSIQCGRSFEYYSEDPLLSGKVAAAITRGVQSHKGCGVTIKHYAANNQETNRYGNNSIVSERAMREIYLKGFGICVREAKPVALMTSYNLLNGTHTAEHRGIMQDILRCEYGFDGLIMTDWIVGGGIMADKKDKHPRTTPCKIAAAGGDIIMPGCNGDYKGILEGLNCGRLTRVQLQKNASRVYKTSKYLNKEV
jgi:beta-glucosidase